MLVALIGMQFFRPVKNVSLPVSHGRIASIYTVPSDVDSILKESCNDCHSNNTRYPRYSNIQPVARWLKDHIDEGKRELNFDEFASYGIRKQYHKLEEVIDQVKKN